MSRSIVERQNFRQFLLRHPLKVFGLAGGGLTYILNGLEFKLIRSLGKAAFTLKPKWKSKAVFSWDHLPAMTFKTYQGPIPQVKLATHKISIDAALDWDHAYEDVENTFALNRFGWLLEALLHSPSVECAQMALKHILSWVAQKGSSPQLPSWESYSVAERLANWPFILLIARKLIPISAEDLDTIARSMGQQLEYLRYHIEYRGRWTNNHVLNNARGLYIGGLFLDHPGALKQARNLFLEWTKEFFYPDGMLKEGSSHYQFLLYQRYEQIFDLAQHTKDQLMVDFMQPWMKVMCQACRFFLVKEQGLWRIPLFGDISPDFPPAWFLPGGSWGKLKGWLNWDKMQEEVKPSAKIGFEYKGDFIRFQQGPITVFWHVSASAPHGYSHAHYDLGSFVLFYEGSEIFSDAGLFSYNPSHVLAKKAKAHNSLTIDSFGPVCEDDRLNLLGAYRFLKTSWHVSHNEDHATLEIQSQGFQRLPAAVAWSRVFRIYVDRMSITDKLKSTGHNMLECCFQMAPGLEVQKKDDTIVFDRRLELKVTDGEEYQSDFMRADNPYQEGWVSSEYGTGASALAIIFHRRLNQSKEFAYQIRWYHADV